MPEEFKPGCQRPAIKKPVIQADTATPETHMKEEKTMIKVGKPAPDFTASAYYNGKFVNTSLS